MFQIIKTLLSIGQRLAQYLAREQLIDTGRAEQKVQYLQEAKDAIQKAVDVRRNASARFDSANGGMPDDREKYYRK